jgi:hypothetical protein
MSTLDCLVEDLKRLPLPKLVQVVDFVHRISAVKPDTHRAALDRTFGCMTPEEADEFQKIIDEGCESTDDRDWQVCFA